MSTDVQEFCLKHPHNHVEACAGCYLKQHEKEDFAQNKMRSRCYLHSWADKDDCWWCKDAQRKRCSTHPGEYAGACYHCEYKKQSELKDKEFIPILNCTIGEFRESARRVYSNEPSFSDEELCRLKLGFCNFVLVHIQNKRYSTTNLPCTLRPATRQYRDGYMRFTLKLIAQDQDMRSPYEYNFKVNHVNDGLPFIDCY